MSSSDKVEEINLTTADNVDKSDEIDSKYIVSDSYKNKVVEIIEESDAKYETIEESDAKYIIPQEDMDKVEIIIGGLIDDNFIRFLLQFMHKSFGT